MQLNNDGIFTRSVNREAIGIMSGDVGSLPSPIAAIQSIEWHRRVISTTTLSCCNKCVDNERNDGNDINVNQ
jgi:hypothetical protein